MIFYIIETLESGLVKMKDPKILVAFCIKTECVLYGNGRRFGPKWETFCHKMEMPIFWDEKMDVSDTSINRCSGG